MFSEITVIYQDFDLPWSRLQAKAAEDALSHRRRSEVFRAMRRVRDFQLVLCARVRDDVGGYSVQKLKQVVAEEKVEMGRDHISPEPLVVCSPVTDLIDSFFSHHKMTPSLTSTSLETRDPSILCVGCWERQAGHPGTRVRSSTRLCISK